jgi:4-amino-4-deoxy-L-arabinose transferase-like glycosyltransferase
MGRRSREKATRRRDSVAPARAPSSRPPTARAARPPAPPSPLAPDTAVVTPWSEIWRADGTAFVVVFLLGLAFRLTVLVQTAGTPYMEVANIDSGSYQKWARELVANGWWPTRHFYQSPFYAYFLAILYEIFGDGPWAPRIVQIVLGSLTPVLVFGLGARLATRRAAWVAALLVALYGPIVLEEVTLSKTSPLMTAAVASVAAYLRYGPGAHPGGLALAGAAMGVAVVGVAQWVLAFAALAAWLPWLAVPAARPRRLRGLAAFVAAGVLVISPVVAWNSYHGGGLVLTSGGGGLNLFSGNNERATGLPASPPGLRDIPEYEEEDAKRLAEQAVGRPLSPAEVDRYWASRATRFMRDHFGEWLTVMRRKLTVVWNAYELSDNYHYAFMRSEFLPALGFGVTLATLGPLALVGMVLPFWRRRALVAFHLAWVSYLATLLIYYVRGRYRLPLVPFLAVLAGMGVERIARAIEWRRWDHVGGLAAGLLAATLFVNHRYCEPPHHGYASLCFAGDMWYDQEYLKLARFHQNRGDVDATLAALDKAAECTVPRGVAQMLFWRSDVERQKADQLESAGDRAGARLHLERARDALRRCQELRYRPDATGSLLQRIEERLAAT